MNNVFLTSNSKGIVWGVQPPQMGACDFCQRPIERLASVEHFEESFATLAGYFAPSAEANAAPLSVELQKRWSLFSSAEPADWQALVVAILAGVFAADDPMLSGPVALLPLQGEEMGAAQELQWNNFAEEIKYQNRFFLRQPVELSLLVNLFSGMEKYYISGSLFYRGRIGEREGFTADKMGKPPAKAATAGRANPVGIPYLYVSRQLMTTAYETRSTYLDFITIALFSAVQPLRVLSLQGISTVSPFRWGDSLGYYLVYEKYLAKLESELKRPLRRFDNPLDYLPTEYLCEFVKSLGYDGIEYGSALHQGGINLAIFNDEKMAIEEIKVYEVKSLMLEVEEAN